MKKFSLLFAMLTMIVSGAWSQTLVGNFDFESSDMTDASGYGSSFSNCEYTSYGTGVIENSTKYATVSDNHAAYNGTIKDATASNMLVSFFINPTSLPTGNDSSHPTWTSQWILGGSTTNNGGLKIGIGLKGQIVVSLHGITSPINQYNDVTAGDENTVTAGRWYNVAVAVTGDAADYTYTLFVNGKQIKQVTNSNAITWTDGKVALTEGCDAATTRFVGGLDDVKFWTGVTTVESAQTLVSAEAERLPSYIKATPVTENALTAGDIIMIKNYNGNGTTESDYQFAYDNGSTAQHDNGGIALWTTTEGDVAYSADLQKYLWKLVDAGTNSGNQEYYLRNIATGRIMSNQTSANTAVPTGNTLVPYYTQYDNTVENNHYFAFTSRMNTGTRETTSLTSLHLGSQGVIVWSPGGNSQWAVNKYDLGDNAKTTYTLKIEGNDKASVWFDGKTYTSSTEGIAYYGAYNECMVVPSVVEGYTSHISKNDNTITVLYTPSVVNRSTATNAYGTICLPYDATSTGVILMECAGKSADGNGIVFNYVGETGENANLEAGKPYLYRATAAEQTFTTTGTEYKAATADAYYFVGTYTAQTLTNGYYFLYSKTLNNRGDDKFHPAGDYVNISAYKCYFTALPTEEARANTNSCVFGIFGDEATGIQSINTSVDLNKEGKFVENGRVVIVKNGQKFNVAGQAVK